LLVYGLKAVLTATKTVIPCNTLFAVHNYVLTAMSVWLFVLVSVALAQYAEPQSGAYVIQEKHEGTTFFNYYNFFTANDPTHGYVNYVDYNTAVSQGLIQTGSNYVIMRADDKNIASGRGRNSIRIETKTQFTRGLYIIDLQHMPTGCATWPAFWTVGPSWPNGGEIDIIEGVNKQTAVDTTLHTSDGCTMCNEAANFTGTWGKGPNGNNACNCYINAPNQYSNQGCGITGAANTMGPGFNNNKGGVYATEWTNNYISVWYWPRNSIPADITSGNPNPPSWGKAYAWFSFGTYCSSSHFTNNVVVFDLTFCGDWAGANFAADCPGLGACNTYVQNNPSAFSEAYWYVDYVAIYKSQ